VFLSLKYVLLWSRWCYYKKKYTGRRIIMFTSAIGWLSDENGQGTAEYALIMALVLLICVAGFTALGPAVRESISSFAGAAYQ